MTAQVPPPLDGVRHEGRGIDFRLVGGSAAGVVLVAGLIFVVIKLQFDALQAHHQRERDAATVRDPLAIEAGPRDIDQRIERIAGPPLEGLEPVASPDPFVYSGPQTPRRQAATPEGVQWVNRDRGIVKIPVDDAMRLMLAERRFKTRGEPRP
jgi:hypothetical protein